jgi:hypothetical protein
LLVAAEVAVEPMLQILVQAVVVVLVDYAAQLLQLVAEVLLNPHYL